MDGAQTRSGRDCAATSTRRSPGHSREPTREHKGVARTMPMQSLIALFLHELGDIYDAQQRIAQILPQLPAESAHPHTQPAYRQPLQETHQQIHTTHQSFHPPPSHPPPHTSTTTPPP